MVMVVLLAGPAFASGAVVEFGVAGVAFPVSPALDTTLGFHHDFTRGGAIEIRARGGLRVDIPGFRPEGYFTGTAHYVTPKIRLGELALTFGFGAGGAYFSGCIVRGDICGQLGGGPIIEHTHRLLFPPTSFTQFFVNLNLGAALLFEQPMSLVVTGGLGVGWLFDLTPGPTERQRKQRL